MIAGLNAGLSLAAYATLPARWAVTGMAGAYSVALLVGWLVTALVLRRRLASGAAGLWRSAAVGAHARLLVAAVPATALGHLAAARTMPVGAVAACAAGAVVVGLVFALLARPLRLTELDRPLSGLIRRLTKRPARR